MIKRPEDVYVWFCICGFVLSFCSIFGGYSLLLWQAWHSDNRLRTMKWAWDGHGHEQKFDPKAFRLIAWGALCGLASIAALGFLVLFRIKK